jgi:hypothetical protein
MKLTLRKHEVRTPASGVNMVRSEYMYSLEGTDIKIVLNYNEFYELARDFLTEYSIVTSRK